MNDSEKALSGAAAVSVLGALNSGTAGMSFIAQSVQVPLWFVIAAWVLPSGEVLKIFRSKIRGYGKQNDTGGK